MHFIAVHTISSADRNVVVRFVFWRHSQRLNVYVRGARTRTFWSPRPSARPHLRPCPREL